MAHFRQFGEQEEGVAAPVQCWGVQQAGVQSGALAGSWRNSSFGGERWSSLRRMQHFGIQLQTQTPNPQEGKRLWAAWAMPLTTLLCHRDLPAVPARLKPRNRNAVSQRHFSCLFVFPTLCSGKVWLRSDLYFCCNSRGCCQVYWHTAASQEQVTELFGTCTKIQCKPLGLFCIRVGCVATEVAWSLRNEF